MGRDKGQIYEASDWFKMALQIDQVCCYVTNGSIHLVFAFCVLPNKKVIDIKF